MVETVAEWFLPCRLGLTLKDALRARGSVFSAVKPWACPSFPGGPAFCSALRAPGPGEGEGRFVIDGSRPPRAQWPLSTSPGVRVLGGVTQLSRPGWSAVLLMDVWRHSDEFRLKFGGAGLGNAKPRRFNFKIYIF